MTSIRVRPLFISILGGLLSSMLLRGLWRMWRPQSGETMPDKGDNLLVWLSMLTTFLVGLFFRKRLSAPIDKTIPQPSKT